jgi:hypothetical protein
MYTNRRRVRTRVSDDSVMRDTMMEMRDLRVSVLHVSASQMCVSHIVQGNVELTFKYLIPELYL